MPGVGHELVGVNKGWNWLERANWGINCRVMVDFVGVNKEEYCGRTREKKHRKISE